MNRNRLLTKLAKLYQPVNAYIYGWLPSGSVSGGTAKIERDANTGQNLGGKAAFGYDHLVHGPRTFAQEVAHLLKRSHTKAGTPGSCDNPTPDEWSDWPSSYPDATIQVTGLNGYGFGALLSLDYMMINPANTYDYMSYCPGSIWSSPWTYKQLYTEAFQLQASASVVNTIPIAQKYFIASGLIFTNNSAILDPVWVVTADAPQENLSNGSTYCLEAQAISGSVLSSQCFDLAFEDYETDEVTNVDGFNLVIPYADGVARIVLKKGNQELAVRTVSANAPVVTVLSPNGGESWTANGQQTITWTASDADGDLLTYSVLYSPDGNNWVLLGIDITESQLTVNAAELAGGANAHIRVLATDGVNTSTDESNMLFTVDRKGPQAYIMSPEGSGTLPPDTPLFLQGYAYDLEDGTLGENTLNWTSNRDGNLGTGSAALVKLSQGQHIITLTATDSNGNAATTNTNIFVGYSLYLPVIGR